MKNTLLSIGLGIALAFTGIQYANAASATATVSAANLTNIATILSSPAKVTQVVITPDVSGSAILGFYDTPTNSIIYTNAAYSNILSYASNVITFWTNYYGRTNYTTNLSLVEITNVINGSTNNYNLELYALAPTNTPVTIPNLNLLFQYGIWVTNSGTKAATITISYTQ